MNVHNYHTKGGKDLIRSYLEIEKEYDLNRQAVEARKQRGMTQKILAEKAGIYLNKNYQEKRNNYGTFKKGLEAI